MSTYRPWLHWYCVAVALSTLFLIIAGAAVTSHEAGLSVPDWPLSYGKVMPEMTGMVFFEHGHRMVASGVGFLTVILATLLAFFDERKWMKKLGFAALGLVIVQGVLGGLTVLLKLPPQVSIAHAATAQLFFTTTVAIAMFTSRGFHEGTLPVPDAGWPSLRSLAVATPAIIFVQLLLGAAFRHKAAGVVPHILFAMLVLTVATMLGTFTLQSYREHKHLRPWGYGVLGVTFLQVVLGVAAYVTRLQAAEKGEILPIMVWFTVSHVALGAVTLATASMLSLQVMRHVQVKSAVTAREAVSVLS